MGTLALLHAWGDRGSSLRRAGARLARGLDVRVVPLDGARRAGSGRAWTKWESDDPADVKAARERVARLLRAVERPLFLFGFSQGGMAAIETALATDLAPEAVVTVGAFLAPGGLARIRQLTTVVPLLLVHGRDDEAVPVAEARRLVRRLRELGARPRLELVAGGHEVAGEALALAARFMRARGSSRSSTSRPSRATASRTRRGRAGGARPRGGR
jgi:predicted esterase